MSCSVVYWSEATSEPPKVVRTPSVLIIFTSKCPSRHNGVHFFDIRTSTSGANMWCLVHFDLEMCFAPQRRALFRHLNFQKWSDYGVLSTFWLGNVLRATTARNCSSLIWPAGSAPAALASLLFDPPEPQIIGKTQCFATFLLFAHLHLLSSYSFSSTLLSSNLSLLSASSLLCFSSLHIVGSLTSKLPSIIIYNICSSNIGSTWKLESVQSVMSTVYLLVRFSRLKMSCCPLKRSRSASSSKQARLLMSGV